MPQAPERTRPASLVDRPGERHLLLAVIWTAGALIRLIPLLLFPGAAERPLGMGGLYLLFARTILEGNLALPTRIPYYTLHGLPYAYPPLAFYIEAILLRIWPFSEFLLVNSLPALFSILTVGAFFPLARTFFEREDRALLATAIYALMPAAFLEHLPGEGLVEGLGTLAFLGGVLALLRLQRSPAQAGARWRKMLLLGLFIGCNILASPGGAYGLAVTVVAFWLAGENGRRIPFPHLAAAAGVGLLVSAPYWLTVSLRHGPEIFARTFFRQHAHLLVFFLAKGGLLIEQVTPLSPWGVLALIGLAVLLAQRRWLLPLWCVLVYLIPREFAYLVAVPLALLATCGLSEGLLARPAEKETARPAFAAATWILVILFAWGLVRAVAWALSLPTEENLVTPEELEMMTWIGEHTPAEATFLVLGDEIEWFPPLTERTTLNVIWGSEWPADQTVVALEGDLAACTRPDCYLSTAASYNLVPDYLYISRSGEFRFVAETAVADPLLEPVRENAGAVLLQVAK